MCIQVHLLIGSVNDIRIYLHLWGALNWHLTTQQPLSQPLPLQTCTNPYIMISNMDEVNNKWWAITERAYSSSRCPQHHSDPYSTIRHSTMFDSVAMGICRLYQKLTVHLMDITTSRSDTTITMLLATHPWIEQSDTNGSTEKQKQKAYHSFMLIFTKRGVF